MTKHFFWLWIICIWLILVFASQYQHWIKYDSFYGNFHPLQLTPIKINDKNLRRQWKSDVNFLFVFLGCLVVGTVVDSSMFISFHFKPFSKYIHISASQFSSPQKRAKFPNQRWWLMGHFWAHKSITKPGMRGVGQSVSLTLTS